MERIPPSQSRSEEIKRHAAQLAAIFAELADEFRIRMLPLLRKRDGCTLEELAKSLGSTPDEVLPHLEALRGVPLVRKMKTASGIRYVIGSCPFP